MAKMSSSQIRSQACSSEDLGQRSRILTDIVVEPLKVWLHREEVLVKQFEQERAVCKIRGTRVVFEASWLGICSYPAVLFF